MSALSTIGSALAETALVLAKAGLDEPRRRARRIVAVALGLSATEIFARPERALDRSERDLLKAIRDRVLAGEPLSRIAGHREFWGLELALSPATLDPRPDSETVVEAVLARLPDKKPAYRLLDLGTGTGCLLLALLAELPAARGIGVDIAFGAVVTARRNAVALGLADRAGFVVGDWAAAIAGGFDVIVANPPYIATGDLAGLPREVAAFDPILALDGGEDGLSAYRAIAADLRRLLLPGALIAVEIGLGQAQAVAALFTEHGIAVDATLCDLAGIPRCLVAQRRHNGALAAGSRKKRLERMAVATTLSTDEEPRCAASRHSIDPAAGNPAG